MNFLKWTPTPQHAFGAFKRVDNNLDYLGTKFWTVTIGMKCPTLLVYSLYASDMGGLTHPG